VSNKVFRLILPQLQLRHYFSARGRDCAPITGNPGVTRSPIGLVPTNALVVIARVMVLGELVRASLVRSDSLDWRLEAVLSWAHVQEVPVPEAVLVGLREFMVNSGHRFRLLRFCRRRAWLLVVPRGQRGGSVFL